MSFIDKELIKPDETTEKTIDQAEKVILSLNYSKQSPDELVSMVERGYRKGSFSISYSPEEGDYKSIAVWLHFYQEDKYVFDEAGFAEYESPVAALASAGLK